MRRRVKPEEEAKHYVRNDCDRPGLHKQFISHEIGYGIVTTQAFCKGDFLLDYHGQLVCAEEAADRKDRDYLYFFEYGRREYCIDAARSDRLGRYVNDSPRRYANCYPKTVVIDNRPHVIIFAATNISTNMELRYDYGGGDLPWREKKIRDIYELREQLTATWNNLEQSVTDSAIDHWRKRLTACVKAEGGHFEYQL